MRRVVLAGVLALEPDVSVLDEPTDRLYVLAHGRTVMAGTPDAVFANIDQLQSLGLGMPVVTALFHELIKTQMIPAIGRLKYSLNQALTSDLS